MPACKVFEGIALKPPILIASMESLGIKTTSFESALEELGRNVKEIKSSL